VEAFGRTTHSLCEAKKNKKTQGTHVMFLFTTQGLGWEVNDAGALEIK